MAHDNAEAQDRWIVEAEALTDEALELLADMSTVDAVTEMRFARERKEMPSLDHLENPCYPNTDSLIR